MIQMSDQLRVDTLQFLLLVGRLPPELARNLLGVTSEPRELSCAACFMFAGAGLHWPLPCLSKGLRGWFDVEKDWPQ